MTGPDGPADENRWAGPLIGTLADQGLFSGANFVLNLLLARWLPPAAYGTFSVAFAAFLFLAGFYGALILEPMSVLGARRGASSGYAPGLLRLHFVLTLPVSLVLALAATLMPHGDARSASLGLAIAVPFSLLYWLARSACYLRGNAWLAAAASAVYSAALLGPLLALGARSAARPPSALVAFALMGAAGLVGFAVAWTAFARRGSAAVHWRDLLREHWPYGRWVLPTAIVNGLYAVAFVPFLAWIAGLAVAGSYRALQNLVLPAQQALAAANTLLALPRLSRQAAGAHQESFAAGARGLLLGVCAASAAYAAALLVGGAWLLRLFYGSGFYARLGWAVPPLAAGVVLWGLALALSTLRRARARPDTILWSKSAGAVVLFGLGGPAVAAYGLAGALWAFVAATAAEVAVLCVRPGQAARGNDAAPSTLA